MTVEERETKWTSSQRYWGKSITIEIYTKRRLFRLGHNMRYCGLISNLLEGETQGKRMPGRPRNSFITQACKEIAKVMG